MLCYRRGTSRTVSLPTSWITRGQYIFALGMIGPSEKLQEALGPSSSDLSERCCGRPAPPEPWTQCGLGKGTEQRLLAARHRSGRPKAPQRCKPMTTTMMMMTMMMKMFHLVCIIKCIQVHIYIYR